MEYEQNQSLLARCLKKALKAHNTNACCKHVCFRRCLKLLRSVHLYLSASKDHPASLAQCVALPMCNVWQDTFTSGRVEVFEITEVLAASLESHEVHTRLKTLAVTKSPTKGLPSCGAAPSWVFSSAPAQRPTRRKAKTEKLKGPKKRTRMTTYGRSRSLEMSRV